MPANMQLLDRLRCTLLACLPHHAVSRLVFRLTRIRTPAHVPVTRRFIRAYGVNMSEAEHSDPAAYSHFNAFFTRALRADARPQQGDPATLTSPVDGRVSRMDTIEGDRVIQAKGIDYSLQTLLGGDAQLAGRFDGHGFTTLYLAPGDYHRIHMPLAGRLQQMIYVPGRLYSVADWTVRALPGVFTRNERVCCLFETASGPLGLVLVGAINVAAIETAWAGLVTPPRARRVARWHYQPATAPSLQRGEEMGRFNMGSTVIVLAPPGYEWTETRSPGAPVRVGEALARPHAAEARERAA
ncbi:MAG: archaetidylserine decarboxylase [Halofilum sp. (in: g-proteobacteria)]|nr:archaetidylserine decarboxylase [Halofilum sp. (in: g-proteobacteria)]